MMLMAVIFDATQLPVGDRNEALEDIFDRAGVPIHVTNCGPAAKVGTRVHYWKFGANDLFVAQGAGLRLTRAQTQLRAAAPEAIRVGFQVSGRYTLYENGHDEAQGAGHVNFTDLTLPCDFTQHGAAATTASFELSYGQLGFPWTWSGRRPRSFRAARSTLSSRGTCRACAGVRTPWLPMPRPRRSARPPLT
jgi:hypothetical protein